MVGLYFIVCTSLIVSVRFLVAASIQYSNYIHLANLVL